MDFKMLLGYSSLFLVVILSVSSSSEPLEGEIDQETVYVVELQNDAEVLAQQHIPGIHDFIRVDVEIVQLINPQGLLATGKVCDNSGECDPKISVFLDTDQPLSAWPGGKAASEFGEFFSASNVNSPIINKNISTRVCGGSVNKVNLRVHVVDDDLIGASSVIEDFECLFSADYRRVAPSASSAEWSPTLDCRPRLQNNQAKLQFRFRLYDITPLDCGIKSASHVRS